MKVLVTGANGFIGSNLVNTLLNRNHDVLALCGESSKSNSIKHKNLKIFSCSMQEINLLESEILKFKPKKVFHLAAQSSPGISLKNPSYTFETNTLATINLLEILKKLSKKPRVILASSSSVYSKSNGKEIIAEDYLTEPITMYGQSKLSMEQIGKLYVSQNDMDIVTVRPFFLIGAGKNNDVCSAFAQDIVEVELKIKKNIEVGNLKIIRDFLDIKDGLEGFLIVSEKGISGEVYNLSSGKEISLKEILSIFKKYSSSDIQEKIEKKWIRKIDDLYRVGNPSKLSKLGWNPKVDIEKSIQDILDFWRLKKINK
jgi:nucleoside-diphosphate-sugar epimerase